MGIFFILIALDGFDDYINFGNVFLYNLIFIFGIFLFSCGIHKLKLEILDTLIINISSIAIAILLFDYFLDIQPEHSFANFMFSVEGWDGPLAKGETHVSIMSTPNSTESRQHRGASPVVQ